MSGTRATGFAPCPPPGPWSPPSEPSWSPPPEPSCSPPPEPSCSRLEPGDRPVICRYAFSISSKVLAVATIFWPASCSWESRSDSAFCSWERWSSLLSIWTTKARAPAAIVAYPASVITSGGSPIWDTASVPRLTSSSPPPPPAATPPLIISSGGRLFCLVISRTRRMRCVNALFRCATVSYPIWGFSRALGHGKLSPSAGRPIWGVRPIRWCVDGKSLHPRVGRPSAFSCS